MHDGKSWDTFIALDKADETDMKAILNYILSRKQVPAHLHVLRSDDTFLEHLFCISSEKKVLIKNKINYFFL